MPLRISGTLYLIGQEAVANAVRHAHPMRLTIELLYKKDGVCLRIADDGIGFEEKGDLGGFGLRGMRKRAASISSVLRVETAPGKGTEVSVTVPLPTYDDVGEAGAVSPFHR